MTLRFPHRRATLAMVLLSLAGVCFFATPAHSAPEAAAPAAELFRPMDVFELEWASDPQVSPDGRRVVYVRNFMDVMTDRRRSQLWTVSTDGSRHRPLTLGVGNPRSPRWSPDGERLLYVSGPPWESDSGASQLWMHWPDTGQSAPITRLTQSPSGLAWSPDGEWVAFSMRVPASTEPFAAMPPKPEGAEWAPPPRVIDDVVYRADGGGFLPEGHRHLFVVPAQGGTPRQVTSGDHDHGSTPAWTPDGKYLVLSANREEDRERDVRDSELYRLELEGGEIEALTDRQGPDHSPAVSPDGSKIAYLGFDDREQGYQVTQLYLLDLESGSSRELARELDRSLSDPVWAADGSGVYVQFSDRGEGRVAFVPVESGGTGGEVEVLASPLGGLSLGRPYGGGQFSVSEAGRIAFTLSGPHHPADVAVTTRRAGPPNRLTRLNRDLLEPRELGEVEEIWFHSSVDGRPIQGWVVKPPGFEDGETYPLILEIHGGPFADYGPRFAAELQLYAAAGYGVLYVNPRGSTSYGEEFGNLIHHAYPGDDYHDLMSGVDAVLEQGWVDPERLYVTGGSGGGVLTAWIVGKTDRFRAAVVAKPVINWASFVLTTDFYNTFAKDYWFPGLPWEDPMHYWERSPLSLVGNVETPTMVLTGEADYRTPMSESEQYYQALQLRDVDTALVRIPEAPHHIARRPSHLIAKVVHVLEWFRRHGGEGEEGGGE